MNNFIKSFLSFGLATSLEKLLAFALLPIYTATFSVEEYGSIDIIISILMITVSLAILQLETSLQRYYYEYQGAKRKLLISNVFFWVIGVSIGLGVIIYSSSSYLSLLLFDKVDYAKQIKIITFQIPLSNISILSLIILRYEKQNLKFFLVILTKVIFNLCFIYSFIVYLKLGISGVFFGQLLALFLSTLLVLYYIKDNFVLRYSKIISNHNFQYALPMVPARIGSVTLSQGTRFFILSFLSLVSVGIYSVAIKLASSIQIFSTAFNMAWAPFMHKQFKNENNQSIFASAFLVVSAIVFFIVIAISLFSYEIVNLMVEKKFMIAYKYIGGLSLFYALYIVKETLDIGPKIKKKTKYISYTFFTSVIINVLSIYLLVNQAGLEGIVYAMIVTNLALITFSWYISNKLYYIPFNVNKFILLFIPTFCISISTMYINLSILTKIILFLVVGLLYGIFILKHYKNIKHTL